MYEIVIADDGSTDSTPEVAAAYGRKSRQPHVRHVRNCHAGLNATRNAGITGSRGEFILFIDDDELVPSEHLERVVGLLAARDDVEGVGGPARDHGGAQVRTCSRCSLGAADRPSPPGGVVRRALLGGNMTIRRRAFERVGLFDEDLSGRGDESEWFRRADMPFLYDPELFIWHRRDQMTLLELCRGQFRQGRALSVAAVKAGSSRPPRLSKIIRLVGHGVARHCGRGYILAARELGAAYEWLRLRWKRPGSTST